MKKFFLFILLTIALTACSTVTNRDGDEDKKMLAANANIQLGMNYLQDQKVDLAKQKLLTALQLTPDYPAAWYTMAYFLEVTGNPQKANDYYLKAIDLAPKSGDTLNNYGTFLCHTGKAKDSIDYFLAAAKDPNYLETGAAYENAGLCALLIPDSEHAKIYFNKALQADPNRDKSLTELIKINQQQGHFAAAQQQQQALLALRQAKPAVLAFQTKP